jgi:hypothetical protein
MTDLQQLKRRIVHTAQRLVVNPVGRRSPMTMLETTGRKSGEPRRTAVGGRVIGCSDAPAGERMPDTR